MGKRQTMLSLYLSSVLLASTLFFFFFLNNSIWFNIVEGVFSNVAAMPNKSVSTILLFSSLSSFEGSWFPHQPNYFAYSSEDTFCLLSYFTRELFFHVYNYSCGIHVRMKPIGLILSSYFWTCIGHPNKHWRCYLPLFSF